MNLPTRLTLLRIALIPGIVALFHLPWPWPWSAPLCAGLFILAGLTDGLDGYLARRLGQTTALGAFLDPVADKLLVCAVLVILVGQDGRLWLVLPSVILISREIAISALREWMAGQGRSAQIAVSSLGKLKTVAQMLALTLLLAFAEQPTGLGYQAGLATLLLAALLASLSFWQYWRAALGATLTGSPSRKK